MFKRKLNSTDILFILTNLIPVYGVFFLGWNPVEAFIVYALETLIVGMLTILKLLVMTVDRKRDTWYNNGTSSQVSGLFFIFFFTMHYGIFAAVQSTIFSECAGITPPGGGFMHFFFHWYEYINRDIGFMLAAFVVSYLARIFVPFIASGEYKRVSMMRVMFEPYGRIFIQQVTVIVGSLFLTLGAGKIFVLIFAIVKIIFDVYIDFNSIIQKSADDMEKQSAKQ